MTLQCIWPAGPPGSELPELELAAGTAAEQTTDGAGRAFLGDVGFAEGSGRVGAPADENAPPGALEVELCAEAAGLAGSGCAGMTLVILGLTLTFMTPMVLRIFTVGAGGRAVRRGRWAGRQRVRCPHPDILRVFRVGAGGEVCAVAAGLAGSGCAALTPLRDP